METTQIKDFYNQSLQSSKNTYEHDRWFRTAQAKAGFFNTKSAVQQYALPLLKDGDSVFELGPGPGTWTKMLLEKAPTATYDLVDISEEMLGQARTALGEKDNITYITSDILDFVPDKQYDFFFSSRIIEYVPDKDKAVATIAGALKSGGYGYIVTKTPQKNRKFGKAIESPVHANQIVAADLANLFETHGCRIVNFVQVTCVFPGLRSGIADRILTTVCRLLPFSWTTGVSESYALIFQKK